MTTESDLWVRPDDWRKYEQYVFGTLQRRFPEGTVRPDAHLRGTKSGVTRQIDVLVEPKIDDGTLRIAVDCKCYKRKVDVKDVESFLGMLDDIQVSHGVLVTTKGYTKAAYERVRCESRNIDLQILSPSRLSDYQFIGCLWLWKGGIAVIVEPPDGWVVDIENQIGPFQFSMYPLGHNRGSAMKGCPFLYGAIVLKTDAAATIEAIAAQDERIVTAHYPDAKFKYIASSWSTESNEASKALLRVGNIDPSYGGPEYSLYIDIPTGALRVVMLCPSGSDAIYLPALEWVGLGAVTMSRDEERADPLTNKEMNTVGCTLFPIGLRQKILDSKDRRLQVVE